VVIYINLLLLLPCMLILMLFSYKYYTSYCLKENQRRS